MLGLPPTGKSMELRGMTILRIEDGKIHEVWENIDLLGLTQQLDAIPSPDQAPAGDPA
jgi:predicted ester cyclase